MRLTAPERSQTIILVNTLTSDLGLALGPGESSMPLVAMLDSAALVALHRLRASADTVVVSSRTVLTDNPRLTVRYGVAGRYPDKLVVFHSSEPDLPADCAIFRHPPEPALMRIASFDELARRLPGGTVIVEGGALLTRYFVVHGIADEIVLAIVDTVAAPETLRFAGGAGFLRRYSIESEEHFGSSRVLRYRKKGH